LIFLAKHELDRRLFIFQRRPVALRLLFCRFGVFLLGVFLFGVLFLFLGLAILLLVLFLFLHFVVLLLLLCRLFGLVVLLFFLLNSLNPNRHDGTRFIKPQFGVALARLREVLYLALGRQSTEKILDRGAFRFLGLARLEEFPLGRVAG